MKYFKYYLTFIIFVLMAFFFFHSGITTKLAEGKDIPIITYNGHVSSMTCDSGYRGAADILRIYWFTKSEDSIRSNMIQLPSGCMEYPLEELRGGELEITLRRHHIVGYVINGKVYLEIADGVADSIKEMSSLNAFEFVMGIIFLFSSLLTLFQLKRFKKLEAAG